MKTQGRIRLLRLMQPTICSVLLLASCGPAERAPDGADVAGAGAMQAVPDGAWTVEDWRIFEEKVRWAVGERLDTLPVGDAIARLGATFVGTTYTPRTLEVAGPERVVVNLRELDCVTFIENVLALSHFVRNEGIDGLVDESAARSAFERYLERIRYRGGRLEGYPSRLHYFSEWLSDHQARGLLNLVTADLGGVGDSEPIDFMSTHPDAYRQLGEAPVLEAVRAMEVRLNAAGPRVVLPEDAIAAAAPGIRSGDLIATTSTVEGLDVAHTGIALWLDGQLHLLHAPLVGEAVQISTRPLGQRIQEIAGQDGVMVARILELHY